MHYTKNSALQEKSFVFVKTVVNQVREIQSKHKEFVLSKQLLRSGTAVGALVSEAEFGQSRADFIHKMSIALKEANETKYWLKLLHETKYIDKPIFDSVLNDCTEIIKMLVSSINTSKKNLEKESVLVKNDSFQ